MSGEPVPGAEIDVWQNAENRLYAVQDPEAPEAHLRGRFLSEQDGGYAFLAIRPTPYPIPADGPVGKMLGGNTGLSLPLLRTWSCVESPVWDGPSRCPSAFS